MSVAQIREQITQLSDDERLELSEWLQDTTEDSTPDSEVMAESIRIGSERLEELRSGRVKGLTHDEFWTQVREI